MKAICVHGFTQTSQSWSEVAPLLATAPTGALTNSGFDEVVALDAPGHGTEQSRQLSLTEGAIDLGRRGGPGVYIGYSMGARLSVHLALHSPELVHGLVMIGGTAGIDDPAERAARRVADEALGERIIEIGVEAFLNEWLRQPLFATLPADHAGAAERRLNSAEALAGSLRTAGTGTQEPLWDRLGELSMPVLVITGELDHKFTEIAQRFVELITDCEHVVIPAVGHAVHLEAPAATASAIVTWWNRVN
jgi:2-succinyl-6-hydroxy-2,4-cyclohexadiene-1-carboxylate synthase